MQLNVRDAAKILNVSEKTIYRWIHERALPAFRVNDQYRCNRAELLEWATSRKIQVSPELFQEPESGPGQLLGLLAGLEEGGIHYGLRGTDKESVLRSIIEVMRLSDDVDREFLLKMLLAREALGSTGFGDGIAIPHVRNPIVLHVERPTITLCFLETPVEFDAIDGKPVHTLFTLVSPTVRAHLFLLSRLAFALRDPIFKGLIVSQGARDEILREAARLERDLSPSIGGGEDGARRDSPEEARP